MKGRLFSAAIVAGALAVATLSSDLPQKWRSWRYSRRLTGDAAGSKVLPARFTLPWEIFAHCSPGCVDLRIVDESGGEVPFLLIWQDSGARAERTHNLQIVENSFVAGEYTQVIGDLEQQSVPTYDQVTVQTSRSDFLVWVEVALSDDAKTWRVVVPKAPIARFRARSIEGNQAIPFRGLSSRYVRVRISDPAAKFPIDGLTISLGISSTESRSEIPASFSQLNSTIQGESVFQAALTSSNQPTSEVRWQTDSQEFYRGVRISGSNDGQEWSYLGSGAIYRYKLAGRLRESVTVAYPETMGYRWLRVEVVNGDDKPLENVRLACAAHSRTVALKYTPDKKYRLLYGNDKAGRARYDLVNYFNTEPDQISFLNLSLQPEELTANYRDPRPFTERHPEVLWVALAVAIVLIGLTAIRTLRTPETPAAKP